MLKPKKSKINTYIGTPAYKTIRKMAIDLERHWSDLLEEGVVLVCEKYGYKVEEE
jgi:hypothetical protein